MSGALLHGQRDISAWMGPDAWPDETTRRYGAGYLSPLAGITEGQPAPITLQEH